MTLTKKLLFVLLGVLIFTVIIFVLFGKNGVIQREQENYNETHMEEREDNNQVVIKK